MQTITNEGQVLDYLNRFETELEALSTDIARRSLRRYVQGVRDPEVPGLEAKRAGMLLDPQLQELVFAWADKTNEPVLKRRLENWRRQLVMAQVSAREDIRELKEKLNDIVIGYKYSLGAERVNITAVRQALRACPDRVKRRTAWHSQGELSQQLAPDLLELIGMRNAAAEKLGFSTYADMVLEHSELSLREAEAMLEDLNQKSQGAYRQLLAEGAARAGIEDIQPWDVQYLLETVPGVPDSLFPREGNEPALAAWAKSMNLDLEKLGIEVVRADIPYNGLCMTIARREIRILSNPADGYNYYKTSFHELGHALHSALCRQEFTSLRRDASVFSEAMAEVFGYLPGHSRWLAGRGLNPEQAAAAKRAALGPWFHYLRQRSAYALFEYQLCRNPGINPDVILAETEARILGCTVDPAPRWAANAWFINYPVYWQNYVLADVIASQIHHSLEANFGPLHHTPAALDYLVDKLIAPGSLKPWKEKLEEVTCCPLGVDALAAGIARHFGDGD